MQEDATSKKFLVTHFNNYKMVDNVFIMEQLHIIPYYKIASYPFHCIILKQ